MKIDEKFIRVSFEDLQTPKRGYEVITDCWWAAKDGHVLGFKLYGPKSKDRPSPQCNKDKRVAEKVVSKMYPGYEPVFVDIAYWPAQ